MSQSATPSAEIDRAVDQLTRGAARLVAWGIDDRLRAIDACIRGVVDVAPAWVEAACEAKRIPVGSAARAEEITAGPIPTLRHLRLLQAILKRAQRGRLPADLQRRTTRAQNQFCVATFPTDELYDRLLFRPIRARTWLCPDVAADRIIDPVVASWFSPEAQLPEAQSREAQSPEAQSPRVACVLGAGNVSSIAATDTLSKIFQEGRAVLLKMNPVNDYLGPLLERALQPLVDADLLRIVYGGAEAGTHAIHHAGIDEVHITGATSTHDAIVWGDDSVARNQQQSARTPVLKKRITSELGNVTPWIVVPGVYSPHELQFQAAHIAASIANNASFNCIATKLIITAKNWPQREVFMSMVDDHLSRIPARFAYYPGASERYEHFAGHSATTDHLPWTLRREIDPIVDQRMLREESFVCVCGEVTLEEASPERFLAAATELANQQIWGTLAVSLMIPRRFHRSEAYVAAIRALRYGTIGVNVWSAISFALCSPPWGAFPGATLDDVQSGIGFVHNTYMLYRPQKTVIDAPLTFWPKPLWFASHRRPEQLAWRLLELYAAPGIGRLLRVFGEGVRG